MSLNREGQCAAILRVLTAADGNWIELWRIQEAREPGTNISQYNARIKELRDGKFGPKYNIENKTEWVGRVCHSWYRLVLPKGQISMKGV